jgi:CheY-like chemotaxis protein
MPDRRILVIDDCRLTLTVAGDILKGAGFEVVKTESGVEANRFIYCDAPPVLILIDVEMPLLRGDRKVRLLKASPSSREIPVILMSHKSETELQQLCLSSGADSYVAKPLRPETLLSRVREFVPALRPV